MNVYNIENNVITIQNDLNQKFIIHYCGSDLYFTMYEYNDDNLFIFSQEEILYKYLNIIFDKLKLKDEFIWISEAYGIEEESHKLLITKTDETFTLKFIQNKSNRFTIKSICPICFCLSGSRNQMVINIVSEMMYKMLNKKVTRRLAKK